MRFVHLATLSCLAAGVNSTLVSVTDGTSVTVSACEPMSYILSSNTTTPESTAVVTTSSSPEETSTEGADDTGGAMARPAERSIAGLIGFLIVGLVML